MKKIRSLVASIISFVLFCGSADTLRAAQDHQVKEAVDSQEVQLAFVVDITPGHDFEQGIKDTVSILKKRLELMDARKKAKVFSREDGLIVVLVKDPADRVMVEKLLTDPGELEFLLVVNDPALFKKAKAGKGDKSGCKIVYQQQGPWQIPYLVATRVLMDGRNIEDAQVVQDEDGANAHIEIVFDPLGAKQLTEVTQRHINEQIAVLYDGKFCCAPLIGTESFNGRFTIDGVFTPEQAKRISVVISSGVLPYPLRLVRSPEAVMELARKMGERFKKSREVFRQKRKDAMIAASKAASQKAQQAQHQIELSEQARQPQSDVEALTLTQSLKAGQVESDVEASVEAGEAVVEAADGPAQTLTPVKQQQVLPSTQPELPAQDHAAQKQQGLSPVNAAKPAGQAERKEAPAASGSSAANSPAAVLSARVEGTSDVAGEDAESQEQTMPVPQGADKKKKSQNHTGDEEPGEDFPRQSRDGPGAL